MAVPAGDPGQAFAGALPDGILVADAHGRIIFAHRQLAALSGYELDELIGLPVETLVPARRRQAHQQHRAAFADMPRTRGLEIVLCRQDGHGQPS
jgi:PAS domain S-box-containing protein